MVLEKNKPRITTQDFLALDNENLKKLPLETKSNYR